MVSQVFTGSALDQLIGDRKDYFAVCAGQCNKPDETLAIPGIQVMFAGLNAVFDTSAKIETPVADNLTSNTAAYKMA
jgi:hypothetical protein